MIKTILILMLMGSGNLFANHNEFNVYCKINIISDKHPQYIAFLIYKDGTKMIAKGKELACEDLGSYDNDMSYLHCEEENDEIHQVYFVSLYHSLTEAIIDKRKYRCEYK